MDNIKVLMVDDESRMRKLVSDFLTRKGYIVIEAGDGEEALDRFYADKDISLVILDVMMPEMDGFSILELLRSSNIGCANSIPVIALTARVDDEVNYLSCGFAGCIRKPFSIDSLSAGISGVIGTAKERAWKPDLSLLFTGEDNHEEMLRIFVDESRKELSKEDEASLKGAIAEFKKNGAI